ncbi:MAG: hypothetical protein PW845_06050 [Pseudomonas sp.]|nr:hypothetical protein [Pseudomonas sp.]
MAMPNKATAAMMMGRRPYLSPNSPNAMAPMTMPTMPAVKIGARAPGESPNAAGV